MSMDSSELIRLQARRRKLRERRVEIANGYQASIERRSAVALRPSDEAELALIVRELTSVRTQIKALKRSAL